MATEIRSQQPYSNPIAPPETKGSLTNDDFRRLMVTPRRVSEGDESETKDSQSTSSSTSSGKWKEHKKPRRVNSSSSSSSSAANNEWLAKLCKEEEEREAEWAKKYRDRAKERREEEETGDEIATSGYRAVAPNTDPYVLQGVETGRRFS